MGRDSLNINGMALKRYSTYANFISMIVSAALIGIPDLGLEAPVVARFMLAGNVIVAACQFVKQQALTKEQ